MIGLTHQILKLKTEFTVRKKRAAHVCATTSSPCPTSLTSRRLSCCWASSTAAGALVRDTPAPRGRQEMLPALPTSAVRSSPGGFVADPRGDFHLEISVQGEEFARALADLIGQLGIPARVNRRRASYAVYIKSAEDIVRLLREVGAQRSVAEIEEARAVKSVKNEVNPTGERRARQPGEERERRPTPARAH